LFAVFLLSAPVLHGQVVDDTTKNVYGPQTTFYTTEENILNNIDGYYSLDTTLADTHNWDPVELNNYYWQYLGTVGTAMQPIFYQAPEVTGRRSGFNVYDNYVKQSDQFRYFDTKSPYTNLRSVIGGNYRAFIGVDFSRNVKPNWNVGFSFRRWTIDKQLGPLSSRGDLNVLTHSYDVYTDYFTPNKKYRVLFNFARTFHKVDETGGIKDTASVIDYEELFDYEDEDINLRNGQSSELKQHYHIYQHYNLSKLVGFYHQFDWERKLNQFINSDADADSEINYLDQYFIRSDSTTDLASYYYIQNTIGLKGEVSKIFYRLYVKRKDIRYQTKYMRELFAPVENYAGAHIRLAPKENWQLRASAEYQLDGNYKLEAKLIIPFLEASALSMQFDAPFFYQRYLGNHDYWRNDFGTEKVQQLKGKAYFKWKDYIDIRPKATISVVTDHLYFNENAEPAQASGTATMIHPGVELNSKLGYFNINADYVYTTIEGGSANVFRIPEHFFTLGFYYERRLVDNLVARFGIDTHAQSTYFADDYDAVTQQFYLQNDFEIPAYIFGDVYASFKIGTAKVFLKYRHFNQGLPADGYFTTPYYTGQQAVFDIGVSWSFFN
jgi:hypothetical protein